MRLEYCRPMSIKDLATGNLTYLIIFVSLAFTTYGIRSPGNARFPRLETAVSVFNAHSFDLALFPLTSLLKCS